MDASEQTPAAHRVFGLLHDGCLAAVERRAEGTLSLRVDIEYLGGMLEDDSESIWVHLEGCDLAEFVAADEGAAQPLLGGLDGALTILSVDEMDPAAPRCAAIHCASIRGTGGLLRVQYDALRIETASHAPVRLQQLEFASTLYWTRWEARHRMGKEGLSIRLAELDDLPAVNLLYRQLLNHLYLHNKTVDLNGVIDAQWVERSGVLFPYLMFVEGRVEPAGLALVGNHKLAQAVESPADFVIWEFVVDEALRGRGLGALAIHWLLSQHPGAWGLDVLPGNEGAVRFWTRVLEPYDLSIRDYQGADDVRFLRLAAQSNARIQAVGR